jgi:hypothetical protein
LPPASIASLTLHERIAELAKIDSDHDGGGLIREVYTADYDRAVEYVSALMADAGLQVRLDAAGNLYGAWLGSEPDAPRVLTGSHFDTTLNAGRYDGVIGVLGAIEAIRGLRARGHVPRRTIEVIGFAGEEPRFGAGCVGSRAMTATISREDLDVMRDRDGISIATAMTQRGLNPDRLGEARIDPRRCTRSWSCTSSRARSSRPAVRMSESSPISPRRMTCGSGWRARRCTRARRPCDCAGTRCWGPPRRRSSSSASRSRR